MKKIFSFLTAILFAGSMWAADGDKHDFAQSLSVLLNNNASIPSINIAEQSYPVKEVIVSFRYNKTMENAVTMEVSVGGDSWGTRYSEGTGSNYTTRSWTHDAVKGAIEIDFTNNTGNGTGHGTFYVNKVTLVEGTAFDPETTCSTPTFNPEAGSYIGSQSVTIGCVTDGATIYYTLDGNDPSTSSATAQPIEISATTTIKAMAVKAGMTNSAIASATYTIYTIDHAGTAADPYSVADARTAIDANTGITDVYAKGIVSVGTVGSINSNGQLTYDLSVDGKAASDQLRVYRGLYIDGAEFKDENKVREGDEVIVKGSLTLYNDGTNDIYEFTANNQLYSLVARTPNFTIDDIENLSTEDKDLAVSDLTVNAEGSEGAITLVSGDETKATIVDNKIHPIAKGDVTITANIAAAGIYRAASTTFNVHIIEICHNNVTLSLGTPEHGTFTSSREAGDYPTCEGQVTVVVTPSPAEHYHVKTIEAPNSASISDPVDGKYTVTYAQNTNAASQINVTFEEDAKATVTWSVNGNTDTKTDVYVGEKPVFPATPAAFDANSTTFYGWATSSWESKLSDLTEKTVYTKAATMPEVTEAVTYYAVFAQLADGAAAVNTVVFNEEFSGLSSGATPTEPTTGATTYGADITYVCTDGATNTKIYNEKLAGGDAPELLVSKTNGSFAISGISTGKALSLELTYKANYNYLSLITSENASAGDIQYSDKVGTSIITIESGETLNLTFKNTNGSNARLDNINIKVAIPALTNYITVEQGGGTAVDNTEVNGKAVKTIVNGQLVIEKNGVRYNAMGQVIK